MQTCVSQTQINLILASFTHLYKCVSSFPVSFYINDNTLLVAHTASFIVNLTFSVTQTGSDELLVPIMKWLIKLLSNMKQWSSCCRPQWWICRQLDQIRGVYYTLLTVLISQWEQVCSTVLMLKQWNTVLCLNPDLWPCHSYLFSGLRVSARSCSEI